MDRILESGISSSSDFPQGWSSLDTLGQLRNLDARKAQHVRKYLQQRLALSLIREEESRENPLPDGSGSELMRKSLWNAFHCGDQIVESSSGHVKHTIYCKHRCCVSCNHIAQAQFIHSWGWLFVSWPKAHFVTLTVPNCNADTLREVLSRMNSEFRHMLDLCRKQGFAIRGVRKCEITYNPLRGDFHPHYHVYVESRSQAMEILGQWLRRWPSATPRAQDLRPAEPGAHLELSKYITKLGAAMPASALYDILSACRNRRMLQTFGGIRAIPQVSSDSEQENCRYFQWGEYNGLYQYVAVNSAGSLLPASIVSEINKEIER